MPFKACWVLTLFTDTKKHVFDIIDTQSFYNSNKNFLRPKPRTKDICLKKVYRITIQSISSFRRIRHQIMSSLFDDYVISMYWSRKLWTRIRTFQLIYRNKTVVSEHGTKCKQLRAGCKITQLPTIYWIPKLHKKPFKARFIANCSSCTTCTTKLAILLTYCLTKIKEHVNFYCDKAYENSGINRFRSIKNSTDV